MSLWKKLLEPRRAQAVEPESPPVAEQTSPELRFRQEVMAIAQASPLVVSVSELPDDNALDLVLANGEQMKCFLSNLMAETRDVDPDERKLRIAHFLSVMVDRPEQPEDFEDAEPMLMPVLRPMTFFVLGRGPVAPSKQPIRRTVLPFLCQGIAIDHPHAMAYAIAEKLERWGVAAERAHQAALDNLARVADQGIVPFDPEARYPIWQVASNDSYESSRLLLPGWLASFEGRVNGRPVAAVPERSTLLVTGDGDLEAIARLLQSARREYRAAPRSISPALYTVGPDGELAPYRVTADHPLASAIHAAEVELAAVEYAAQKERLQAELEAAGEDVFVSTYAVIERKEDGAISSYCTWGEGVDCLLPIADSLALIGQEPGADEPWHVLLPWAAAERLLADHWQLAEGIEPPRMRTLRWPEPSELDALRARSEKD